MNTTDYSEILKQQQQQNPQQRAVSPQQFAENQQQPAREQVAGKLANGLGSLSEAASTTGIPEQAAHEIVSRAYRSAW